MIHRFWHDSSSFRPPPFPIIDEYVSCQYAVKDWSLEEIPYNIKQFYYEHSDMRQVANILRLVVLWTYGGIWIDHDIIPLIDLEAIPKPFAAATGSINSCVMGFPAGHPMLYNALEEAINHPQGEGVVQRSGSVLLHRHLTRDVQLMQLPFDSLGHPIPDAKPWAIHLFHTSHLNRKALSNG